MNTRSLRTGLAAAVGGAVLVTGLLLGASFAFAQDSGVSDATDEVTEDDQVTEDDRAAKPECDRDRVHIGFGDLDEIAAEFGLSMDELKEMLADGSTLEEIAADAGVDLEEMVADLRTKALEKIDDAVAEGDLTEEQADRIKERIESFEFGDGLLGRRGFDFRGDRGFPFLGSIGGLLEDVDLDALREELESGASLDEALEGLGVDVGQLLEEALETATAHLDDLVADGSLTQERADEIKERLESIDLTEGLPFGIRDFRLRDLDMDGFDFDFDGFRGHRHRGRGFGFFGGGNGDAEADDSNADGVLLDI